MGLRKALSRQEHGGHEDHKGLYERIAHHRRFVIASHIIVQSVICIERIGISVAELITLPTLHAVDILGYDVILGSDIGLPPQMRPFYRLK